MIGAESGTQMSERASRETGFTAGRGHGEYACIMAIEGGGVR